MSNRSQFAKRCRELGLTFEVDRDERVIRVNLPENKVLTELDVHYLDFHYDGWPSMAEVYDELLSDLAGGLSDCQDEGCDICNR